MSAVLGRAETETDPQVQLAGAQKTIAPTARFQILELEDKYRSLALALASTLVSLVDLRDSYTGGHSTRVASYSRLIATELDLSDAEVERIILAASLHDIGKIGVPDHILLKEGRLTDEEMEHMRRHSEFGWAVLRDCNGFEEAGLMLLHHHERIDGNGYPGRLSGSDIPLGARIIAVCDTYDALTTNRPYRKARTHEEAVKEIFRCAGAQHDRLVVDAFLSAIHAKELARSI
jgi:HD-GYP domain-containing protein (c-di-GMP phosphodiesterase class II)